MKWQEALHVLRQATVGRSDSAVAPRSDVRWQPPAMRRGEGGPTHASSARAHSLCIASGKGGTGKSVLSASLAHMLARRGRTLLIDADLGVGNAHLLQGVSPELTLVDVVEGRARARQAVESCGGMVDLLAGGSGIAHMAELSGQELEHLALGLEELESEYRWSIVDSAAGVSSQTLAFAVSADLVLLVTTPDLTAMTDAYAFLKALLRLEPRGRLALVVNRAHNAAEAKAVGERICAVARRFLDTEPGVLGWLPDDRAVRRAVNARAPVVRAEPRCAWSRAAERLALALLEELACVHPGGLGQSLVRSLG